MLSPCLMYDMNTSMNLLVAGHSVLFFVYAGQSAFCTLTNHRLWRIISTQRVRDTFDSLTSCVRGSKADLSLLSAWPREKPAHRTGSDHSLGPHLRKACLLCCFDRG